MGAGAEREGCSSNDNYQIQRHTIGGVAVHKCSATRVPGRKKIVASNMPPTCKKALYSVLLTDRETDMADAHQGPLRGSSETAARERVNGLRATYKRGAAAVPHLPLGKPNPASQPAPIPLSPPQPTKQP